MLFNFKLTPLERVQPWGRPGEQKLHWFGLTDGEYWIQAGTHALLEYSALARTQGAPHYCNYQVARLYEDLQEIVPHVLDPVPSALTPYLFGERGRAWDALYASWHAQQPNRLVDKQFWETADASATWIAQRTLDTSYLSPPANVRVWSDGAIVHFAWDNARQRYKNGPAWSAFSGSFDMPQRDFTREVNSFHTLLMEHMSERVRRVAAGELSGKVQIDLPALEREHASRCSNRIGRRPSVETDWRRVLGAIQEVQRSAAAGRTG